MVTLSRLEKAKKKKERKKESLFLFCVLGGKEGKNKTQADLSHKTLERLSNSRVKCTSED